MKKKDPPKNPVTAEHFQHFGQCIRFWQDTLGMTDWRIALSNVRCKGSMAEIAKFDLEQRTAKIKLGTDWSETEVTARSLSDTALHEVLHIFLYEFKQFCLDENMTEDDRLSAEHRVINILEKVLSNASPLGPRS